MAVSDSLISAAISEDGDYEVLTGVAQVLEKTQGRVIFSPPPTKEIAGTIVMVLQGGIVTSKELGQLLWYVADILEDVENRVN